ncbi:UDP-glycosyltransferase 76F1 isoform X2 [Medicago truncatula]|uniref:UDP-glycosyltransferase 76F1 isoform X2 n=1 Tax=Medicago truncatula TaxID=3880 RepID=UPI000D2F3FBC|nr:UDP-glycosyltransferase 76F1 isoform X2 [Medicago truncatula]
MMVFVVLFLMLLFILLKLFVLSLGFLGLFLGLVGLLLFLFLLLFRFSEKRVIFLFKLQSCNLKYDALRRVSKNSMLTFVENLESRMEEAVEDLPPLKVKDLPVFQSKEPEAFYKLVCRFIDECKKSSGIIWNTFEELESSALTKLRQDFSVPIYPIGPFHKYSLAGSNSTSLLTPDKTCISWLDKQEHKRVVYVSFGSIVAISEAEFLEIAWGLVNSNQPFLWAIRPGTIRGSEWLEPLPSGFLENLGERGYIVKWAPQEQVLKHPAVGAFWTHNGWNSTLESVCEGVPMICMPSFGDQKINAKYASDVWKVGVQLEGKLERGEIEKVIRKLMVGDEGNEIRENVMNLKEKANVCLKEGGSSYSFLDSLVSEILSLKSSTSRAH